MFKYGTIPFGNTEEIAMNMKELGEFIAAERKRQGVTQLQLSQAADVGRRFVVEVESGKATVQAGKLLKVLDTLGVSIALTTPEGV
jgi:y4mF family transcriptional regulator